MALSYNSISSGGATGADFTINVGTSGYTKSDLAKNFGAGNYICTSTLSDSTLDIYLLNEDGTVAGYANAATSTTTISASKEFRYVVVYGSTSNDTLTFQYKTVVAPTANSTADLVIGPRLISVVTSALPNINDTTVVTGHNFATDVSITFSSSTPGYTDTPAKSIVRSSSTSLIITRPDNLSTAYSPYTITALNPGTVAPTSSNVHKLTNAITAGSSPVWVTSATLPTFSRNVSYSTTLSATDADGGSSVTYSYVSGSLPTGISFNAATATISGTATTALTTTYTVRATDSGGNYVDRTFTLTNATPVWSTTSPLSTATVGSAYSVTLSAPDDSGVTPTFTLISGSLPSGLSLSSAGVISGTPSSAWAEGSTATIRATDANGYYTDRVFEIPFPRTATFTSSGSWTAPSGVTSVSNLLVVAGGGGAGGMETNWGPGAGGAGGLLQPSNVAVTPGTTYTITVGGRPGNSSALGYTAIAGGNGANDAQYSSAPYPNRLGGNGGSGGGGGGTTGYGGSGTSGQGHGGGSAVGFGGGGGGGSSSGGGSGTSNSGGGYGGGTTSNITGSSYEYSRGGGGGTAYYYGTQYDNPHYTSYGWGGTRMYSGSGGTHLGNTQGGPGIVVIRYIK